MSAADVVYPLQQQQLLKRTVELNRTSDTLYHTTRVPQCIEMQPYSNSSNLLIMSCSRKNSFMIHQTVKELSRWQTHTSTNRRCSHQYHLRYAIAARLV